MLWLVCILWLGVLIWLSSEDGTATAQTSGRLTAFVVALFRLPARDFEKVDHALRTAAHGVGFMILGWLAYTALRLTREAIRRPALWVIAVCGPIAVLDEVKKLLIAGRHLSWPEAGLNVLGVCAGVAIAAGLYRLVRRKRALRNAGAGDPGIRENRTA